MLPSVDLNLLRILEALLDEQSVTGAARRLGVTQSAVSHALARLREQLDDALFVRTTRGMSPTPRAEELREPLRRGLAALREAVDGRMFEPASATRTFTIAMTDQLGITILPTLSVNLAARAPSVDLNIAPVVRNIERALESGTAELVLTGSTRPLDASALKRQLLFDEELVCIVRADHPVRDRLTLERFCGMGHVLVSPRGGGGGIVDDVLAKQGIRRRVAVTVPHFIVAPHVIAATDYVLTVAASLAHTLAPVLGLRILEPPIELPRASYWQLWHERTHADPGHKWLRGLVAEAASHGRQGAPRAGVRQSRQRS